MLKGAVVLAITYIGVIFARLPFINIGTGLEGRRLFGIITLGGGECW
ncbi:MAG: hypothetical protein KJ624_01985 [Chloroflexi bacterium]|nr:hypothetical protein [Chloroflexota bacterium]